MDRKLTVLDAMCVGVGYSDEDTPPIEYSVAWHALRICMTLAGVAGALQMRLTWFSFFLWMTTVAIVASVTVGGIRLWRAGYWP